MIDEQKLIEQLKGYKNEWKLAEPFHEGIAQGLKIAIEATEKQPKVNEWIPVSAWLPKKEYSRGNAVVINDFFGAYLRISLPHKKVLKYNIKYCPMCGRKLREKVEE